MGGNLAAELEDWSFAPSNHPGVPVFRRTMAIFAPSNHPGVAKIRRRVNGIRIPLTAAWRRSPNPPIRRRDCHLSIPAVKLYNLDVLKAWDYAQTIFYSEKLQIAYIKAEKDTRKHIFWYFEDQKVVQIFHKLRIQGRMQIFEKKSQSALNHVLIG